jgi:glycosyltransferase involved in cell wall biosynthesis
MLGAETRVLATYGVDTDQYRQYDKELSRHKLNLPETKINLYTGSFARDKNMGALLHVYNEIKKAIPDSKLIISCKTLDNDYMNALKRYIDDENVIIGSFEEREMPYLYSAADLFATCATSYFETSGRSVLEALSCSVPVLVPNWIAFNEYVRPENLVPVDFFDEPLYDWNSYAMVNLKEFGNACVDLLQSNSPWVSKLPKQFEYKEVAKELKEVILAAVAQKPRGQTHKTEMRGGPSHGNKLIEDLCEILNIKGKADILSFINQPIQNDHKLKEYQKRLYYTLFKDAGDDNGHA